MTTLIYTHRTRSFVRSAAFLLVVAGTGYVAGTLFNNTTSPHDGSAAFAAPVQAAESKPRQVLPPSGAFAPGDVDWGRSDVDRTEAPRECDATRGVTTACVFLD
jgi:hypothetical protein